jgi:hypothetical protein
VPQEGGLDKKLLRYKVDDIELEVAPVSRERSRREDDEAVIEHENDRRRRKRVSPELALEKLNNSAERAHHPTKKVEKVRTEAPGPCVEELRMCFDEAHRIYV